eukprot:Gregarina_sp_Poly_1__832@NODE_119_length_13600_cov_173_393926_g106_i0_p7_GENE_NODE_119_length_13600_cov_173_393926_g106_i0NODE_119_length_13600_cov_173_393926_g106_i0_p7_ORF_typecomplete_len164_score29_14AAA_23/PF13476_6/6_8e07AAA_13/PF13166_6/0_0017NPV_P10/PF05531_12/5_5e02NPV_P10/PF05531_12/0_3CENPF_leu_zip/PF10473_9/5_4e02CENPF_leu_zip/PF10473_9/0_12FmiP_Thoc5/PF09766_9/0_076FliD_N/PF02465_18/2_9FliD_N/PF02465_18/5_9e02Atg14/PF10186_9/0_19_NODE_119_length_13600_cov_173_393926_g106_i052085699
MKEKDGTTKSTSNKCVDVNTTISGFMGVSKAVLENVIFCHQEDGNWPLSDMATLKKKFDELFGAVRFTKALEAINNVRKNYGKMEKEKRHEYDLLNKDLVEYELIMKRIALCDKKGEQLESQIEQTKSRKAPLEKKIWTQQQKLQSLQFYERDWNALVERIEQ